MPITSALDRFGGASYNVWIEGERNTLKRPQVWPDIAVCDQVDTVPGGTLAVIDQQQPKGPAFAMWMKAVGGALGMWVGDMVNFVVGRICDQLGVEHRLLERWGDPQLPPG